MTNLSPMKKFPNQSSHFLQQEIDFSQWSQKVYQYQRAISQNPCKNWLLFEQDSYWFSIFFFALLAADKQVILPPSGQIMQLKHCMKEAEILLSRQNYSDINQFELDKLEQENATTLEANPTSAIASSAAADQLSFAVDNPIIFFTSGSTAQPKAVTKTFGQLILEVETIENTFARMVDSELENQRSMIMATVSHQHIYGLLFKLLWPIWSGRDVDLRTFEYPEHLVHQIEQYPGRKICLISSPAYYHRLLKDNVLIKIQSQLNALFSSGGPLNADAAMRLSEQLGVTPIEVFGSTETGGIAWRQKSISSDEIWQAFPQISCRHQANSECLEILSPYVDQSQWYTTDDRVELLDNQRFKLLGRADRIVKIEEKRCSLDEIQHYLALHPWVEQAFVTTIGGQAGQRLCLAAVVELTAEGFSQLTSKAKFQFDRQLKTHLKDYVEALVVPRKFRYLERLPYNSQGKLNKKQMEALFD